MLHHLAQLLARQPLQLAVGGKAPRVGDPPPLPPLPPLPPAHMPPHEQPRAALHLPGAPASVPPFENLLEGSRRPEPAISLGLARIPSACLPELGALANDMEVCKSGRVLWVCGQLAQEVFIHKRSGVVCMCPAGASAASCKPAVALHITSVPEPEATETINPALWHPAIQRP